MKRFLLYLLPALVAIPAAIRARSVARTAGQGAQRPAPRRKAPERKPHEQVMVYITDHGTRYHKHGCRALLHSKTAHRVALEELPEQYEACHECHPPAVAHKS